jgi:general secretion pathway protein H
MPTSGRGSERGDRVRCGARAGDIAPRADGHRAARALNRARGFTLIELLVVLVLVAIGAAVVSLALRDGSATKLEEEGARLAALLEGARAEARASGVLVRWTPGRAEDSMGAGSAGQEEAFRFEGLPVSVNMPRRWLDPRVTAQIVGATSLVLGPDAIVPAQRVVLSLDDRRIEIGTDGLAPFAIKAADAPTPEPAR